jgi:DNA mismatch endonuclease (patch repair protein)
MPREPRKQSFERTTFGGLSRSQLMSRVRSSRNATTELRFITLLRAGCLTGWRRNLPLRGKPDFVFASAGLVVFVDGCFWHGHQCGRNLSPKNNARYWRDKILLNRRRDQRVTRALRRSGWRVARFWECQLARSPARCLSRLHTLLVPRSATNDRGLTAEIKSFPRERRSHKGGSRESR